MPVTVDRISVGAVISDAQIRAAAAFGYAVDISLRVKILQRRLITVTPMVLLLEHRV